ncbi:hypothetical protein [Amycolatopsis samaneae]|uniref:ESX-1 secretion-associated protein n=1 Tax=Amycolatopsis samaneae TaxID=664691 RepID=A0ABW5GAG6_9PSEU
MNFDLADPGPGAGYHVYPETLRAAADGLTDATDLVNSFVESDLVTMRLGEHDLGLPGTATVLMPGLAGAGTVARYNQMLDRIQEISLANTMQLAKLTDALRQAAAHYEQLDREAYERLKKIEGGLK